MARYRPTGTVSSETAEISVRREAGGVAARAVERETDSGWLIDQPLGGIVTDWSKWRQVERDEQSNGCHPPELEASAAASAPEDDAEDEVLDAEDEPELELDPVPELEPDPDAEELASGSTPVDSLVAMSSKLLVSKQPPSRVPKTTTTASRDELGMCRPD